MPFLAAAGLLKQALNPSASETKPPAEANRLTEAARRAAESTQLRLADVDQQAGVGELAMRHAARERRCLSIILTFIMPGHLWQRTFLQ